MSEEIVGFGEFTGKPYLTVAIRPEQYDAQRLTLARCREILRSQSVRIRGWDFPHVDANQPVNGNGFVFGSIKFMQHIEAWRFATSGQFLFKGHLWDAVNESFQETMTKAAEYSTKPFAGEKWSEIRGFISFVGLIFSCTEICMLAARLAQAVPYDEGSVHFEINLRNILGYALASSEPGVSLHALYMAQVKEIHYNRDVDAQDLIASPSSIARSVLRSIFEKFNWNDARDDMMETWQRSIGVVN